MSSDNVLEVLDLVIEPLVQRDPRTWSWMDRWESLGFFQSVNDRVHRPKDVPERTEGGPAGSSAHFSWIVLLLAVFWNMIGVF